MKRDSPKQVIFMAAFGLIPVIWLGLLVAPVLAGGALAGRLPEVITGLTAALNDPLRIEWTEGSLKTALFFVATYATGIGIYLATRRNTRPREEHGSAKWGEAAAINRKYAAGHFTENKILTQNVRIGFDAKKHRRNLNVMIVGGSGSGKTRFYAKPNAMQANSSMVILDPKGEIARDTGRLLAKSGMDVKVLDLINMERSHCYNPFVYLTNDNDVQRLVTNLFKATAPKNSQPQDPFWETAASMLLMALMFYLHYEAPPDERNFTMVMEMLRSADVQEENEFYQSPLDVLFERLEMRDPEHIAVKYYHDYRAGAGKTLKSIQITLAARLEKFNLESLASLTVTDELNLSALGEKKTALYVIIPDNDTSFNFLVSILYTQLFQQLFYSADHKHGGSLPIHVHFLMDEFANGATRSQLKRLGVKPKKKYYED
jgi:type IV secretion system protein VirD4